MKKILPLLLLFAGYFSYAQTVIYDNGPLVTMPGGGSGGADVSHLWDTSLTTYGYGHAVTTGYWVADDFTVPAGDAWTIDSVVFYAYQTGSTTTSTINEVRFAIWDGVPEATGSSIIAGDTSLNNFLASTWSGIYRTNGTNFSATDRPIMRTTVYVGGTVLQPGTYWMQWQSGGSLGSGPWAPPVTIVGTTNTGNAMQFNPTLAPGSQWSTIELASSTDGQDFPYLLIGSALTSVNDIYMNSQVSFFPNPMVTDAVINIDNSILSANSDLRITIVDVIGKQVQEIRNINSSNVKLNRQNLEKGVYFYELKSGNRQIAIGKFVVN